MTHSFSALTGVERTVKKPDKTLSEIEKTQAKLRDSIQVARDLAEKSDKLIKKHRREMKAEGD